MKKGKQVERLVDTVKGVEIEIRKNSNPFLRIKKLRDSDKLDKVVQCIKNVIGGKIITVETINNYSHLVYDSVRQYEVGGARIVATNKQQLTYLNKINAHLEQFCDLIDNSPIEVINMLHSIQDPLEMGDYYHFASSKEISECFFDSTGICKARMLVGMAIGRNKVHLDKMEDVGKDKPSNSEGNQRGKRNNDALFEVTKILSQVFIYSTNTVPTRICDSSGDNQRMRENGKYVNFLREIFAIFKIKVSPENQAKKFIASMELIRNNEEK